MPMIDLTIPRGSIEPEARAELLDELATALLSREGAPDNDFFRSITWIYAHEVDGPFVGGRPGGEPRFRVEVTVPEGALSASRKEGFVKDATELVLGAAGLEADQGIRVWTLIREVPEGNWGAAGAVVRFAQLREAAHAEREYDPAGEAAPAAS